MSLFINWNPDLIAFHLGPISIRWYSLCWIIGLLGAYLCVRRLYIQQKYGEEKFEPLFLYCFCGIIIGARLGHCIFYQPDYFLTSAKGIFEMLIPVKLFGNGILDSLSTGQWHFTGYEGLASHGGSAGALLAIWLYCRHQAMKLLTVFDMVAIATPITCTFIRLGNLMNSEIIGKPTDLPWAFVFERTDLLPRHPGQLYEALFYALMFLILWTIYSRNDRLSAATPANTQPLTHKKSFIGSGLYFGILLFGIFTFRFFIEYTKEEQVDFENGMLFNMGQLLSVPFIIAGALFTLRGLRKKG
ncbi:MAG: prolipoprotein diacylglyceryl transferase [Bacteroidales bacterium]|nr:prolipoprotein diacylglyceryl transferase [Bacteroidales bacterium]MCM1146758.1 prolipoprotein diacylglyceryl transferase [Bacteroidales bacterium]MCM1205745.1 prolipoprotein diacylglyceryl transferase [Bacillota bacterium]MCM1511457.1 prolipoprotein diacylglyceryl transferase [Clostridium sp.]